MKFSIGASSTNNTFQEMTKNAKTAEDLGYDLFTMADVNYRRELFSSLAIMADRTESINIGSMVTNPVTRHPVVIANAICTIDDISDGRANLGIATGDSAVRQLNERPAKLDEMEQAISLIKRLARGDEAEYNDVNLGERVVGWGGDHEIPIFWTAEGPKTQKLAGRMADVVVIGTGIEKDVIENQVENVDEGIRSAGRDRDDVEIWVLARSNIDDERTEAIDDLKSLLAGVAHHSLQFTMEGKCVPEEYRTDLEQLVENYSSDHHAQNEGYNKKLVEDLGLTDYLATRYGIVGTTDDCIEKLHKIEETGLIDGVHLSAPAERKEEYIKRFGRDVIPCF